MAYATLGAVKARAGALSSGWTDTSRPSNDDVKQFLEDVAAEIDALLGARSLASPDPGTVAANALASVNADGALVLALRASFPETSGPAAATGAIDDAAKRYDDALVALGKGEHPAVMLLEAGDVGNRASSFFLNEPYYGIFPFDPRLDPLAPDANPNTAPTVARGQSL